MPLAIQKCGRLPRMTIPKMSTLAPERWGVGPGGEEAPALLYENGLPAPRCHGGKTNCAFFDIVKSMTCRTPEDGLVVRIHRQRHSS